MFFFFFKKHSNFRLICIYIYTRPLDGIRSSMSIFHGTSRSVMSARVVRCFFHLCFFFYFTNVFHFLARRPRNCFTQNFKLFDTNAAAMPPPPTLTYTCRHPAPVTHIRHQVASSVVVKLFAERPRFVSSTLRLSAIYTFMCDRPQTDTHGARDPYS